MAWQTREMKPFLYRFLYGILIGYIEKSETATLKGTLNNLVFACLVKTFVNNSYDLIKHFTGYAKCVSLATKLSHRRRRAGDVLLFLKRCFSKLIDTRYDQMLVIKLL